MPRMIRGIAVTTLADGLIATRITAKMMPTVDDKKSSAESSLPTRSFLSKYPFESRVKLG